MPSSIIASKAMGWCTAQFKMLLFCVKTTMKESCNFEVALLEERKHFGRLVTFCFGTFAMLFVLLGVLFIMKTLKDEL